MGQNKGNWFENQDLVLDKVQSLDSDGNFNGSLVTDALAAEHGAGAIGVGGSITAPQTRRWTENGVIVTQIKFDITGLKSSSSANDAIGVGTVPAYIGRNVVATNGVVFKAELSCIELPVTGDLDIDIGTNAAGTIDFDEAVSTGKLIDGGSLAAGQTVANLVPAMTANDYLYIVSPGSTVGTYTGGQFVLTMYGHALLA